MIINKICLIGRASREPETKYFESGKVICKFSIAVNRFGGGQDEPPDWFDLEMWDKTAEIANEYVKKGSQVGIVGSLSFDSWTDRQTGAERSKPFVRVFRLDLLGSKRVGDGNSGNGNSGNYDDDF